MNWTWCPGEGAKVIQSTLQWVTARAGQKPLQKQESSPPSPTRASTGAARGPAKSRLAPASLPPPPLTSPRSGPPAHLPLIKLQVNPGAPGAAPTPRRLHRSQFSPKFPQTPHPPTDAGDHLEAKAEDHSVQPGTASAWFRGKDPGGRGVRES